MTAEREEAARVLARELQDVDAAIELVVTGEARRVTLTGLRFGQELVEQIAGQAFARGAVLDPVYWPEDAGCDLTVRPRDAAG